MSPLALSIRPSQYFKGNDGNWSTFNVNIDNQAMQVLPATSQSFTAVVLVEGCPAQDPYGTTGCEDRRGGIFTPASSFQIQSPSGSNSTYFALPFDSEMDLPGYNETAAEAGFDSLSLVWSGSSAPQNVQNQLIAGYAAPVPWVGFLGIRNIDNHLLSPTTGEPSLLQTLKNNGSIPSAYFGYTAGAWYKSTPAFGSLTFGGYDAARVDLSNTVSVPLQGTSVDLSVYINRITIDGTSGQTVITNFNNSLALIDSLVPEIWLPTSVCNQFESALGLIWNETVSMYLIDETQHSRLLSINPSFTFNLAANSSSKQTTTVTLPYAAFDLLASFPLAGITDTSSLRYFPLQRAVDSQNLFLGRTFLQEAYIAVNYDNMTLTVGQAKFPSPQTLTDVQTIGGSTQPTTLTGGDIAGIVIGAVFGVALIAGLVFLWWRRRRQHYEKKWEVEKTEREKSARLHSPSLGGDGETTQVGSEAGDRITEWYKGTSGPHSPPVPEESDGFLKPELDATPAAGFSYFRPAPRIELDANAEPRPSPHRSQQSWGSGGSGVSPMPSEGRVTSMQIGSEHSGDGPLSGGASPPMLGVQHSRQLSSDSQILPVYEMGDTERAPREVDATPKAEPVQHIASSRGLGVSTAAEQSQAEREHLADHNTTATGPTDGIVSPEVQDATPHITTDNVISPETAQPRSEAEATVPKPQPGFF